MSPAAQRELGIAPVDIQDAIVAGVFVAIAMFGAGFWVGVWSVKPQPPEVRIVKVEPPAYQSENCIELARACYARRRSAKVGFK